MLADIFAAMQGHASMSPLHIALGKWQRAKVLRASGTLLSCRPKGDSVRMEARRPAGGAWSAGPTHTEKRRTERVRQHQREKQELGEHREMVPVTQMLRKTVCKLALQKGLRGGTRSRSRSRSSSRQPSSWTPRSSKSKSPSGAPPAMPASSWEGESVHAQVRTATSAPRFVNGHIVRPLPQLARVPAAKVRATPRAVGAPPMPPKPAVAPPLTPPEIPAPKTPPELRGAPLPRSHAQPQGPRNKLSPWREWQPSDLAKKLVQALRHGTGFRGGQVMHAQRSDGWLALKAAMEIYEINKSQLQAAIDMSDGRLIVHEGHIMARAKRSAACPWRSRF